MLNGVQVEDMQEPILSGTVLLWYPVTLKSKAKPNQNKRPFLSFVTGQYFLLAC